MPNVDGHQPGAFCWVELATLDVAAAKKFYGALFGWTFVDFPMGEFGEYTIFRINDRDVAAAYPMMPDQREQGIPPNWMSYVSVDERRRHRREGADAGRHGDGAADGRVRHGAHGGACRIRRARCCRSGSRRRTRDSA